MRTWGVMTVFSLCRYSGWGMVDVEADKTEVDLVPNPRSYMPWQCIPTPTAKWCLSTKAGRSIKAVIMNMNESWCQWFSKSVMSSTLFPISRLSCISLGTFSVKLHFSWNVLLCWLEIGLQLRCFFAAKWSALAVHRATCASPGCFWVFLKWQVDMWVWSGQGDPEIQKWNGLKGGSSVQRRNFTTPAVGYLKMKSQGSMVRCPVCDSIGGTILRVLWCRAWRVHLTTENGVAANSWITVRACWSTTLCLVWLWLWMLWSTTFTIRRNKSGAQGEWSPF